MTDQGLQQIVVQQPGALRTAQGQQIQLQLVTEDGESAGQIFLQMPEDGGGAPQQIEVQHQPALLQQVNAASVQQVAQQQQVRTGTLTFEAEV